jgi:TonB-linked SusC/RagA family outer membrane protein
MISKNHTSSANILLVSVFLFAAPFIMNAQNVRFTGTVSDEASSNYLSGISVVSKGSSNGTSTDENGRFAIDAKPGDLLIFSSVGYESKEIKLGMQNPISVRLTASSNSLQGVVVNVGYGTMKKTNLTGAVSSLSAKNLKDRPVANFGTAMVGQIAGVQIQQVSVDPGDEGLSVRVRGAGSITQSNDPLYVVDGYPMEGSAFRLMNPSDIESIEVLKDASSTAIYGSRGANGVVIINTKKGKGPASVNLNIYTGFQQLEKKVKMMNRDQYVQYFIDARNQAWLDMPVITADPDKTVHSINDNNSRRSLYPGASFQYIIPDGKGSYKYNFLDPASVSSMPDNDWQDLLYRNAKIQQYEVSVSGGTEKSNYLFSGSYIQQDGIVINSDYNRFNFRTSVSSKIKDNIEVGMTMNSYSTRGHEQPEGRYSPMSFAINLAPIFPVLNSDGTYGSMVRNPEIVPGEHVNPIGYATQLFNFRKRNGWLGTVYANWDIIKDLRYRISVNGGVQNNTMKRYQPSYVDLVGSLAPRPADASNETFSDNDWVVEQTLNYTKSIADRHDFTAMIGYTTQKHSYEHMLGAARGFPNDNIYTLNAGTMRSLTSDESEYSMVSYLARLNYAYENRYLLTATIRRDGSSRFGKNNKWGNFPSISAGWRLSEEKFMQRVSSISELKLRASFGIAGNNRIGDYSSIGLLRTGLYPTGNTAQITVDPSTLSNNELGWEKSQQVDVGIDVAMLSNRLRFTADFYNTESIGLLLDAPVPSITGFLSSMQNIGKVRNSGVEFQLSTNNLVKELKWSTDFNVSFNKNKVLQISGDRVIYAGVSGSGNTFITQRNYPIASFFGYVYLGVFQNEDELNKTPHNPNDKVGDGKYLDSNGDGILDDRDKTVLGDNHPDFTAGFSNHFSYKDFTLDFQLTGSYGAELFSFFKRMVGTYNGDRNGMVEQLNRWVSPNDPGDGIHFRPTTTPKSLQLTPSSAWVTDASYLRVQNVTFGYNLPDRVLKNIKMKNLHLYITGQNLLTITDYPGLDPATSSEGYGLAKGGDFTGYPVARSVIIGANIRF